MNINFRFLLSALATTCICAISCNKADNPGEPETGGWKVSISAVKEDGPSNKALSEDTAGKSLVATFKTTDNIYVYNKTKRKADPSPLHPDQDGAKANLIGTLSESYDEGDELVLCYNPEYIEGKGLRMSYGNQKGDLGSVADFAKASKTVTAAEASAKKLSGSVNFENLQSIFRLTFTYSVQQQDGSTTTSPVSFKRVIISTKKKKLIHTDMTCHEFNGVTTSPIVVTLPAPSAEPVYVALRNENTEDDTYIFQLEGDDGFVYQVEKEAPAGKIVDGKFYTSEMLAQPQSKFTVTANGNKVGPNDGAYGYKDYEKVYVTGTGIGQYIFWSEKALPEITLDNVHLVCHGHTPITSEKSTIYRLIIKGDNTLETDASHPGISFCSFYTLMSRNLPLFIEGNGNLTITASNSIGHSGILNSYGHESYGIQAANGYTLTLEDKGDNGDGTATWLYKIRSN